MLGFARGVTLDNFLTVIGIKELIKIFPSEYVLREKCVPDLMKFFHKYGIYINSSKDLEKVFQALEECEIIEVRLNKAVRLNPNLECYRNE